MEATMPRLILLGANGADGADGRFYFNRVFFNRLGYLNLLDSH